MFFSFYSLARSMVVVVSSSFAKILLGLICFRVRTLFFARCVVSFIFCFFTSLFHFLFSSLYVRAHTQTHTHTLARLISH